MRLLRSVALFCLLARVAVAQPSGASPRPPNSEVTTEAGFHFSLLPKAFASNPTLEMTVNTQLTPFGHSLPEVSPEHPVYYLAHDSGYHPRGETVGEHPPPAGVLQHDVIAALAERGYLPAGEGHPPSLVLFFVWGSHNAMDLDQAGMFPLKQAQEESERAMLVGGPDFRKRQDERNQFGSTPADNRAKEDYLRYQMQHDMYYAIISAYDFAALAHKERKLAWRTTMTVNATGVSMTETLPVLVASSAFYLGRETTEPVAVTRDLRRGTVTLGPLKIIERVADPVK